MITGGVTVSDNAVREAYMVQGTKVKFDYAVVSGDDLRKTINPIDADLQAFFKQNAARYANAIPETRKIEYAAFDASNLPGGKPQVTDADVQAYYTAHQDQYQVKDQVKVRHILIAVPAGADAKTDAAAKAKAEDLLKQIKSGGNFADLAAKNSDDPGSKTQGGELGWLDPGKTVPEFDKAAFSLAPGQTSDVIKTQFGYHILQVEEKTLRAPSTHRRSEAADRPHHRAAEVRRGHAELRHAVRRSRQDRRPRQGRRRPRTPRHHHRLPRQHRSRSRPRRWNRPAQRGLRRRQGAAPAAVSTGEGYAVFQVADIKPAHAPDFAEYKEHILDDYREQQLPQLLSGQLNKLDDRAKQLNDLKKAAAEMNIPFKTSELVGKDGQVPDLGAMSGPGAVAFTLPKGAISGPINAGRVGVVLSVTDKQEPTPEDIAKNFSQVRDQLLNEQREEIFRVYIGNLTDKYEKAGAIRYSQKQPAPGSSPLGN